MWQRGEGVGVEDLQAVVVGDDEASDTGVDGDGARRLRGDRRGLDGERGPVDDEHGPNVTHDVGTIGGVVDGDRVWPDADGQRGQAGARGGVEDGDGVVVVAENVE